MKTIYCRKCGGSGDILGGGMMHINCDACNGHGYIDIETDEEMPLKYNKKIVIDKRSLSYKEGVKEIMALHPHMSKREAQIAFDQQLAENT